MSKVLNRIAPQDEVLLETDIGKMIPSAKQLAEERVTRFNADKEIRLRVKALEEKAPDAAVEAAKTQALAAIDTKAQAVNSALDTKVTEANTAIDGKVAGANQAKTDAETAKTQAVTAKGQAEGFASQASTSASNASKSAENAKASEDKAREYAEQASQGGGVSEDEKQAITYNNNCAKITEYPTFVQTVCKACGITSTEGFLPLDLVYTMANGWMIVALEVPYNTSYLCVFDADWELLRKEIRNGDVRSNAFFACEEVNGVAYAFSSGTLGGSNTLKYTTISVGEDGKPLVSLDNLVDFGELTNNGGYGSNPYTRSHSQVLGKYIIFAYNVFNTETRKVEAVLDGSLSYPWRVENATEFYANIGGYITKFSLDSEGKIDVSKVQTTTASSALAIRGGGDIFGYVYATNIVVTRDSTQLKCAATFGKDESTYGTRQTPSQLNTLMTPFYHRATRCVIGSRVDGSIVAWNNLRQTNAHESFMLRERILLPLSAYNIKTPASGYTYGTKILGVDNAGMWMCLMRYNNWSVMHCVGGKVLRVLWEDLK